MQIPSDPWFHDEAAAYAALETVLWPQGPVCAHCGAMGKAYELKGSSTRLGLRKCGACRKQFTVKVGTPFESAHIPLHKYLAALYLFSISAGEPVSPRILQKVLAITYKSAWTLGARLRAATRIAADDRSAASKDDGLGMGRFARVCEVYCRHFQLTSHTPGGDNGKYREVAATSLDSPQDAAREDAVAATKSGTKNRYLGWVRERVSALPATTFDIAEEDRARAHVYALLGGMLARAPSADLLSRLGAIEGDASPIGQGFAALAATARKIRLAEAQEEHSALFIGLTQGELTPYASYYLTGFLHEKPLARLRGDMARLGIEPADNVHEPEDHIGALCEMMAGLIEGRFGAPLDVIEQRDFFQAHLASWAGRFFNDLAAAKSARLYMPVGVIGKQFIDVETEAFAMA